MGNYDIRYDILSFRWDKEARTFTTDAWDLYDCDNEYSYPFPSDKKQFVIVNKKTGGFRRFRFVKEIKYVYDIPELEESFPAVDWLFESEDGIKCLATVSPV
jgi:hypothetical protein